MRTGSPAASAAVSVGALSGSTPMTRQSTADATPAMRPPPPIGTTIVADGWARPRRSRDPPCRAPPARTGSSNGWTNVRPVCSTNSSSRPCASAGLIASRSTSAPYPRVAATLSGFALAHMNTVQATPSWAAANAAPWAAFPADHVTIPRFFSSAVSDASLFSIPRGLNDPVRWRSSAFRKTSGPSVRHESVGVRWRRPSNDAARPLDVVARDRNGRHASIVREPFRALACSQSVMRVLLAAARDRARRSGGGCEGSRRLRSRRRSSRPARAPCGIAARGGSLWIGVYEAGALLMVDDTTGHTDARVQVGRWACSVAVGPAAVWVARDNAGELVRVSRGTGRIQRLKVGTGTFDVLLAAGSVWTTSWDHAAIVRTDARTGRPSRLYKHGPYPAGLASCGGRVWVGHGRARDVAHVRSIRARIACACLRRLATPSWPECIRRRRLGDHARLGRARRSEVGASALAPAHR